MFNVVIFGAPGSGKGTQSDKIVEKYGLVHLSTGDILRAEIAKGSEVGKIADGLISKGQFVPDDVIIAVLENAINEHPQAKGFIFDGFPRTVTQAEALDSILKKKNIRVSVMLNIDVDQNELVKRLLNRGKTSGRADDNLITIQERINVYEQKTMPVIQFYDKQGKHVRILAASVTTGYTAEAAVEAIKYYGGTVVGISAIFATTESCGGFPVYSVFNPNDLPDYASHSAHECPLCKQGVKLDALVNSHGFSKI